ncbi:unnamed protein product [Clavelina lepadiformis]|uniref:Uncharacterized protein n=1 Tax=Clavelina lepadiformis TaxID=159417 RepID=A0ABP0FJ59_CLALP
MDTPSFRDPTIATSKQRRTLPSVDYLSHIGKSITRQQEDAMVRPGHVRGNLWRSRWQKAVKDHLCHNRTKHQKN